MAVEKKSKQSAKNDKRIQKTIQWDPDVLDALEKHNKQQRLNNLSAAANDAVRYALFPEFRSDREKDVVKLIQGLGASLYEHRKNTARDLTIMQEGFFQFVLEYFMHTHHIPKGEQSNAKAQGKVRLEKFMEELMQKLPQAQQVREEKK